MERRLKRVLGIRKIIMTLRGNMKEEKKYIVKFNGGLGNQMFQYAFGKSLETKTGVKTIFDMSFFEKKYARPYELNIFGIEVPTVKGFCEKMRLKLIWKFRKKLKNKTFMDLFFYPEAHFEFDEKLFNLPENTYIEGFFQSEKYFSQIEGTLRKEFQFKNKPDSLNQNLIEMITSSNSISLHIRRGDYVQKKRYQNLYATCSLDYYKRGVEYIAKTVENLKLFIFSDDPNWVKQNLDLPYECIFVDNNSGSKSYEDMRLMSLCKHNVIANSSFSWWGAWLNNNQEKIVIAPRKWFNDEKIVQTDVIPDSWVRIDN